MGAIDSTRTLGWTMIGVRVPAATAVRTVKVELPLFAGEVMPAIVTVPLSVGLRAATSTNRVSPVTVLVALVKAVPVSDTEDTSWLQVQAVGTSIAIRVTV